MKGKSAGCLVVIAVVAGALAAVGAVVIVRGLKELNGILEGDML